MKKLNKTEVKTKNALSTSITEIRDRLEDECGKPEDEREMDAILALLARYNAALSDALDFCEDKASRLQDYMDDRSESWRESDAASACEDWKSQWEDVDFEPIALEDLGDPPNVDDLQDHADTLDQIPDEVEG